MKRWILSYDLPAASRDGIDRSDATKGTSDRSAEWLETYCTAGDADRLRSPP